MHTNLEEGEEIVEIGETVITPTETAIVTPSGEVVIVPPAPISLRVRNYNPLSEEIVIGPGTSYNPGLTTQGSAAYKELSPEVQDLMKERQVLREERQKAQQAMDELRKWIQDLKQQKPYSLTSEV
jgi:hypothetical protein